MEKSAEGDRRLPAHKQELIDWLYRFKNTDDMIRMVRHYDLTPEQTATWQRDFRKWLTPKERNEREARHVHS